VVSFRAKIRLLPAVSLAALINGCGPAQDEPPGSVLLGVLIDHSAASGRAAWGEAAQLAREAANLGLKGLDGWQGVSFGLVFADTANAPHLAVERARELVQRDNIKGLLVDASDVALAIIATHYDQDPANDVDAPVICLACTSSQLNNATATHSSPVLQQDGEHWLYRTAAHTGAQAVALLRTALALAPGGDANGDGLWKVGVYLADGDAGNAIIRSLQEARDRHFPATGEAQTPGLQLEVVRHPAGATATGHDWASDLQQLVDPDNQSPGVNPGPGGGPSPPLVVRDGIPDAIIDATSPVFAAAFARAHAEHGQAVPVIHHDSWRRERTLIELAPRDIEGQQGVSPVMIDNCSTSGGTFAGAMVARTGHTPGLWDAQAHDGATMLMLAALEALRFSGSAVSVDPAMLTGKQVRAALETVHLDLGRGQKVYAGAHGLRQAALAIADGRSINYEGASGPVDFDEGGNVRNNFVQFRVKQQRFVDETTFTCVSDPLSCPATRYDCRW
jgi:hypothetical protein